jgi:hypothetical protein
MLHKRGSSVSIPGQPCGMRGNKCGNGRGFSPNASVFPVIVILPLIHIYLPVTGAIEN